MARETYIVVSLFTYDPENDPPYEQPLGLVAARALNFANHANATAVFDRAKRQIDEAAEKGAHLLTERIKPGPARRTATEARQHAAEAIIALEEIAD